MKLNNLYYDKIYSNSGNHFIIKNIPKNLNPRKIFDIGCGNGSNARIFKKKYPTSKIDGITLSLEEKKACQDVLNKCWIYDIEHGLDNLLTKQTYDIILLSHVLEHLKNPANVIRSVSKFLTPNGIIILAVPNTLFWRQRIKFFFGDLTYTETGILDKTHLRLFTYQNIEDLLQLKEQPLEKKIKLGDAKFPISFLRKVPIFSLITNFLDFCAQKWFPNLFSWQIVMILSLKNRNGLK